MGKRTFLGGLLSAIGLSKTATAQEPTRIDPRTILFSLPTIANDAPALTRFEGAPSDADLVMHEDEWRQLEFFRPGQLSVVQDKLRELKTFEAQHRVQSGWREIYVRHLPVDPVLSGANAVDETAAELGARVDAAPIVFHGTGSITGRVRDGFTLALGPGAFLYGFTEDGQIPVLGAHLRNADDRLLTDAFATLSRNHGLLLVDWRAQMLLMSVDTDGQLIVWSP